MSSHKAIANPEQAVPQGESSTADMPLSILLDDDDDASAAVASLSASALRSAGMDEQDDEDEVEGENEDRLDSSSAEPTDLTPRAPQSAAPFRVTGSAETGLKPFREDSRVDRRIIEGMLRDRDLFIEEMEHEGFTQAAVLRRAAELGLSEALIRQVKGVAADLAGERPGRRPAPSSLGARTCLSCDRVFLSSGPGNRLCMRCRGGDAGLAQL